MQQYLSMPFEQTQKQTEIARHLPPPLYVLFVQANAYGQACGKQSAKNGRFQNKSKLVYEVLSPDFHRLISSVHFRQESECLDHG